MQKLFLPFLLALASVAGCENISEQDYIDRALTYIDEGRDQAAVVELKNALSLNPDSMRARWLLGERHLNAGRFSDAAKELSRAREIGISDDSVLPLLARALLENGQHERLRALQTADLSPMPRSRVLAAQAATYTWDGDLEAARAVVEQALAADPESIEVQTEQARLEAAVGDLDRAVELLRSLGADHRYGPAWALLADLEKRQDRVDAAETAYGKAVEHQLSATADLLKRGLLRIDMKKYPEARADLERVKKQLPKHFEANFGLGLIHFRNGRFDAALPLLELSVAENGAFKPALFYLAATHLQLGNAARGESLAAQYVANVPNSIPGRKLLAQIRYAEEKFAEVEALLKPVVSATPDDVAVIRMLASALLNQSEYDEAYYLFEMLADLVPEDASTQMRLGALLLLKGDEQQGFEALDKALQRDPALFQVYEIKAGYLLQQQAYGRALEVVSDYRSAAPESAKPQILEGKIRVLENRPDLARQAFEAAREIEPDDVSAKHALASLDTREGDYAGARALYQSILAKTPDHLDTLMKLAMLEEVDGNLKQMVANLQQAIASHPSAVLPRVSLARHYLAEGQPDLVPQVLDELAARRQDLPAVLEVYGLYELAQGDADSARLTFLRLVELQPGSANARFLLARSLSELNDGPGLQRALERTLELDSDNLAARIGLARVMLLSRDLKAAEQQLEVLERRAPGNPDVLSLRGAIARASGDATTALETFAHVFEEFSSGTTMLALARQKWNTGDEPGALALMEKWVAEHPDDAAALLALASANNKAGHLDKAVTQYQRALERFGQSPVVLNNLAWLLKDDDPRLALEYAEQAVALAPASAAAADTHAMLLSRNGQHTRAQRVIARAIDLTPGIPLLRYHSALIDVAAGQRDRAISTLTSLLQDQEAFPERTEAEQLLARLDKQG